MVRKYALNKKCVLIKERFIALPIITAPLFKAYQRILVESITQGHDTKKEIWKLRIGEVLEVYIYIERERERTAEQVMHDPRADAIVGTDVGHNGPREVFWWR